MDSRQLRDLLDAAAGDPPRRVTVAAVRRRLVRRRMREAAVSAAAVALIAGLCVAAAQLAGAGGGPPLTGPARAPQQLLLERVPVKRAPGSLTPGYLVRDAYRHQASCRQGPALHPGSRQRLVGGYRIGRSVLVLHARWAFGRGIVRVSQVDVGFDETDGSLALPFMIFWLSPSAHGVHSRWATSTAVGNRVRGSYRTGWGTVNASAPVSDGAAPSLHLQLWALNSVTNTLYCVAETHLPLTSRAR
jgi:hypothetical protein